MNMRQDDVEQRVQHTGGHSKDKKDNSKLSTHVKKCFKSEKSKVQVSSTDSELSSDEEIPCLSFLKSSKAVQKRVNERLAEIESSSKLEGNEQSKTKSKRGGGTDVVVTKKVTWPQHSILSGTTKQRVTYDQLSLVQFVQGFTCNIIDESNEKIRERMLWYLNDLMEDAADFGWSSAKASHAVLLCEMERGTVDWLNTQCIDCIRRTHAQKYSNRQNWGRTYKHKRPWFCKLYQQGQCTHVKDHEMGGKTHKHVCSFCLSQGCTLPHPEKAFNFLKKADKKRASSCSSALESLSSKGTRLVSQCKDNSIQQHIFMKVVSQPGFYDVQKTSRVKKDQMQSLMSKQYGTVRSRCVYISNGDRKCVEGLLVGHYYKKKLWVMTSITFAKLTTPSANNLTGVSHKNPMSVPL